MHKFSSLGIPAGSYRSFTEFDVFKSLKLFHENCLSFCIFQKLCIIYQIFNIYNGISDWFDIHTQTLIIKLFTPFASSLHPNLRPSTSNSSRIKWIHQPLHSTATFLIVPARHLIFQLIHYIPLSTLSYFIILSRILICFLFLVRFRLTFENDLLLA